MNKQDAIWILEEVKMFDDSMYQYNDAYLEALDMAIEALKTDAIPIEWIEKTYPIDGVHGTASYFRQAHAIKDVVERWRNEEAWRDEI